MRSKDYKCVHLYQDSQTNSCCVIIANTLIIGAIGTYLSVYTFMPKNLPSHLIVLVTSSTSTCNTVTILKRQQRYNDKPLLPGKNSHWRV